jgi:hypothetical protein
MLGTASLEMTMLFKVVGGIERKSAGKGGEWTLGERRLRHAAHLNSTERSHVWTTLIDTSHHVPTTLAPTRTAGKKRLCNQAQKTLLEMITSESWEDFLPDI